MKSLNISRSRQACGALNVGIIYKAGKHKKDKVENSQSPIGWWLSIRLFLLKGLQILFYFNFMRGA